MCWEGYCRLKRNNLMLCMNLDGSWFKTFKKAREKEGREGGRDGGRREKRKEEERRNNKTHFGDNWRNLMLTENYMT